LTDRLRAPGPKRILSLDGGGIRGCASLGFLEHLEATVRARTSPAATLADYFDLIGGTSTGAIIATLLALGKTATLKGFPFHWPAGANELLIVSVGTGIFAHKLSDREVLKSENLYWAKNVPELLMQDATEHNELMLQYLSQSPTARAIDWEVGNLDGDLLGGEPQLTYIRYNATLEVDALNGVGQARR
jgi:hypothetical protein